MILVDFNNVMVRAIVNDSKGLKIDENISRHIILNCLRSYRSKHFKKFGELVLACDSRNSWRKEIFPYYKKKRKTDRDTSGIDWDAIFECMNIIKKEIITYFPYKLIEVDRCEGDDIIASITKWTQTNDLDDGIFDSAKPLLIVSGDEDFVQLQKYPNVHQLSTKTKKFIVADKPIEYILLEHILRGDSSDGVPNVKSDDDTFVNEAKRQSQVRESFIQQCLKTLPTDEAFKKNYKRNNQLVNLDLIPKEYEDEIINTFINCKVGNRSRLMTYFIKNKLNNLFDNLQDF